MRDVFLFLTDSGYILPPVPRILAVKEKQSLKTSCLVVRDSYLKDYCTNVIIFFLFFFSFPVSNQILK